MQLDVSACGFPRQQRGREQVLEDAGVSPAAGFVRSTFATPCI